MTKVKICGLTRRCDIAYVNAAMPDLIGFIFAKSRRRITPDQAVILKAMLHPGILAAGVFVNEETAVMAELANRGIIDIIQLHGKEDNHIISRLRDQTDVKIMQAFAIQNKEDLKRINESTADYYLLDNKQGGGGIPFDWTLLENLENFRRPVFLAGGMNPGNVQDAVIRFHPYGVDISSGVETDGYKDEKKINDVIRRIGNDERKIRSIRRTIYTGDTDERGAESGRTL